ncbi:lipase [Rhizocola hellebori]|uniref:Lipase n=1 Tax=Rhizocola hellebori TaxID=1392758 RepID=A0A8J3Q1B5_9ACTN|nr:alpha/beta fold hydrolase [Rhizocola hellebori]GIH01968.1 lipase [Rhizocola hellebori]
MRRKVFVLAAVALLATALPVSSAQAEPSTPARRPVVFVHGSAGSAMQFQTQAKRLASNGYPAEIIEAHDYDSTFATETPDQIFARLDQRIARLLAQTGADKVDLLGHSLGTFMAQSYLASPLRAATVAHYVNLDGRTATALPGGVPTLAVWGEGSTERTIIGATNVYFSDQSHTQVVTSPETFVQVYRFFTGAGPRTTQLLPEPPGRLTLSGRAVLFPTNVGVAGATLQVYAINPLTGARRPGPPLETFVLPEDGSFGPFRALGFRRYEFALVREGAATHHFYFQPSVRSDRLIRLLAGIPGQGLDALTEKSEAHTNLVISRNKEWWGDQGEGSDALYVNGQNILNAANTPRVKRAIGIFAYDRFVDRATDLTAPIPAFFAQTFITGMDVYVPAAPANLGIAFVAVKSRTGGLELVNVPNWPSAQHRVTIQVNDYD